MYNLVLMEMCEPEQWVQAIRQVTQEDDEVDQHFFLNWLVDVVAGRWDFEETAKDTPPKAA